MGGGGGQQEHIWLLHYATIWKVKGSSPNEVDFFQFAKFFQLHYGPRVDSASNRNEYQESSWEVKGGQRVRLLVKQQVSEEWFTISYYTVQAWLSLCVHLQYN
jgi:hypothetical protein